MNVVEFVCEIDPEDDDIYLHLTPVQIKIDGRRLLHIVTEIETAHAIERPARVSIGDYEGLTIYQLRASLHRPANLPGTDELRDNRATLLGCTCGIPECWPIQARIVGKEDVITWDKIQKSTPSDI